MIKTRKERKKIKYSERFSELKKYCTEGEGGPLTYTILFALAGAFAIFCRSKIGVSIAIIGMYIIMAQDIVKRK
jgi:hypothetical protein